MGNLAILGIIIMDCQPLRAWNFYIDMTQVITFVLPGIYQI